MLFINSNTKKVSYQVYTVLKERFDVMTEKRGLPERLAQFKFTAGDPRTKGAHVRNQGVQLKTILKKLLSQQLDLDDPLTKEKYKMSVNKAIALKLIKRALDGNLKAIEMIFERIEGKVAQRTELTGANGGAVALSSQVSHDLSALSSDELLALRETVSKIETPVQHDAFDESDCEIIDAELVENFVE